MGNILGILGAIGGVGGGVISNIQNSLINQENNANQRYMLDSQQKWSHNEALLADERQRQQFLDLYSPQARVKQLKEAGLSVGMMYGAGSAGGSGTTSGNQATAPAATSRQSIPMGNVLDSNIARLLAETELIKSQTRKNNAEAGEKESQIPINQKMITVMATQIDEMNEKMNLYKAEANQVEANTKNQEALANYNETLNKIAQIELNYKDNTLQAQVSTLWQQYDNLVEEGEKLQISNEKLMEVITTDIKLKLSEILKNGTQDGLIGQQEEYYEELTKELKRTNEVNSGLDDMIDNIIHVIDDESKKSESTGKMKGITKALMQLAKLAAVYIKILSKKKK